MHVHDSNNQPWWISEGNEPWVQPLVGYSRPNLHCLWQTINKLLLIWSVSRIFFLPDLKIWHLPACIWIYYSSHIYWRVFPSPFKVFFNRDERFWKSSRDWVGSHQWYCGNVESSETDNAHLSPTLEFSTSESFREIATQDRKCGVQNIDSFISLTLYMWSD